MILYVKNMVSERCKLFVENELRNVGLCFTTVDLGVIDIAGGWTQEQREELEKRLIAGGLEIMINRKSAIIEKTEAIIKEMVNDLDEVPKGNYSEYLSERTEHDYALLSKIFSEAKGITIQQYIILSKIERIIELLADEEMTLTDISYKLHYSSVAHLSNQFKKITGYSPTDFRKLDKPQMAKIFPLSLGQESSIVN